VRRPSPGIVSPHTQLEDIFARSHPELNERSAYYAVLRWELFAEIYAH